MIEKILHNVATGKISRSDVRDAKDLVFIQRDPAGGGWMSLANGIEKVEPERFDLLVEIHYLLNPKSHLMNIGSSSKASSVFKVISKIKNK